MTWFLQMVEHLANANHRNRMSWKKLQSALLSLLSWQMGKRGGGCDALPEEAQGHTAEWLLKCLERPQVREEQTSEEQTSPIFCFKSRPFWRSPPKQADRILCGAASTRAHSGLGSGGKTEFSAKEGGAGARLPTPPAAGRAGGQSYHYSCPMQVAQMPASAAALDTVSCLGTISVAQVLCYPGCLLLRTAARSAGA